MDAREERGMQIAVAQGQKIVHNGRMWLVPSQTGVGKYGVTLDGDKPFCTCPDHETTGKPCKHVYAVQFKLSQTKVVLAADGSTTTITNTLTVTQTVEKKPSYKQDWPNYNAAQVNEYGHFQEFLYDLCRTLPEEPRKTGRGRPSISHRDGLFAAIFKVYSLMSARRFSGELAEAHERGYLERFPHFNSVLNVFDKPEVTPLLKGMIETSALPLRAVESCFAADSTGFATSMYTSWFDHKWGTMKKKANWVKAHFATGVKTNIVTTVEILDQSAADSPQLPTLVNGTAKNFQIGEFSADKAYASGENFEAVEKHGGRFFPMFKENTTGKVGGSFEKAFHYFSLNREEYLKHYHLRSNVESTVSMVKRKFGDSVKSKNELAQKNEVYAKFVAHNLCVLIQEMYTLGIDPSFGRCTNNQEAAQIIRFLGV